MWTLWIIVFLLGVIFAALGIIFFIKKMGEPGENTIKFLGGEFKLANSALVFFVVGVLLIVYSAIQNSAQPHPDPSNSNTTPSPTATSTSTATATPTATASSTTYQPTDNSPPWLKIAWGERGISERGANFKQTRLNEYLSSLGMPTPEVPVDWSAAFVHWALNRAGYPGIYTNDNAAWLNYGVQLNEPKEGCIVVLRGGVNDQIIHSGFYLYEQGGSVCVLGGNVSDEVKSRCFPKFRVAAYRFPPAPRP